MKLIAFGQTDIGKKRKTNQDAFLKDDALGLYVVADGMGGHRGGEVASQLAVENIQKYCQENPKASGRELLDKGINLSCESIYKMSQNHEELAGMGTTVMAIVVRDGAVYVGQVGDSRAYLINGPSIWQITEDHSLLNEEIRSGRLSAGDAPNYQFKNVITRSVGYEPKVNVDIYRRVAAVNDIYLLCSDGLSGLVEIQEIAQHVHWHGLEKGIKLLIDLANQRGGDDNVTVVACQFTE